MELLPYKNKRRIPLGPTQQNYTFVTATCYCGKEFEVRLAVLKSGDARSCGCYRKSRISQQNTTHGMTRTPTHNSWASMKMRCKDKNHNHYRHYGGRGIKYIKRWEKFENFLSDMGERPPNKTLDRKNPNGNYSKRNCRWASSKEQANNQRNRKKFRGETSVEASIRLGGAKGLVAQRLNQGWSNYRAFNTPCKKV